MTSDAPPPNQSTSANVPDWDAIARFLAGESSAQEATSVQRWLEANPLEKDFVARLDAAIKSDAPADVDVEAALARVPARMAHTEQRPRLTVERGPAPARWRTWTVGALLTAAAVVGIMVTLRSAHVASTPIALAARTYTTKVGQRDSVQLADGSRVLLGPDSRLTV